MSQIYCSNCGKPNQDSGRFCFACGSQLSHLGSQDSPTEVFDSSSIPDSDRPGPGKQLAHYRIKELIGRGGFGEVYAAQDENLDRLVALKVLPAEVAGNPERLERFRREARAVAGLSHPNIVTLHSIEEASGVPFITMELIEGRPLDDVIPPDGFDPEALLDIALPLAQALIAAHEKGITHRDLKPANIMVDLEGQPKILDFGLAKIRPVIDEQSATRTAGEDLTGKGVILGTVAYMAPEQVQGRPADARADLFSLGVVLYQMITGRKPFGGKSAAETMSSILRDQPTSIGESRPGMPADLVKTIERCLKKAPDERIASARELAEALEATRRQLQETSFVARLAPAPRPAPLLVLGAALVVVVAAVVWVALRSPPPTPSAGQRIVVLPMENLGPPEDAYFAAGLTDEIIGRLSAVTGLAVVSRTTAVQYLGTGKSVREIGAELEVDYALEGSVRWQKSDDATGRIRVMSQLIRVVDDTNVWSQSYDHALEDVFVVQGDIAGQVVEQLNLTLMTGERQTLENRPTANMEAYQAYLKGLEYVNSGGPTEDQQLAIEMLERAVELDPEFAQAWAWLAHTNARIYGSGTDRSDERKAAAREQVDRALALDSDLPEALTALGYYHYWTNLDYDQALEAFRAARENSPSNIRALIGMAYAVRRSGDMQSAVEYLAEALRLDPRDSYQYLEHGLTFIWLRDYDKAYELFDKSIELDPERNVAYLIRGEAEWYRSGDVVKAGRWLEPISPLTDGEASWTLFWQRIYERNFAGAAALAESMTFDPTTWWFTHTRKLYVGLAYWFAGDKIRATAALDEARQEIERRILRTGDDRVGLGRLHGALGLALAGLGQKEDALRHGRHAIELHSIDEDQIGESRLWEMAAINVMVNEPDGALDNLETLLSRPGKMTVPFMELDPTWDPLREHPRYAALVEEFAPRDGRMKK